jgi:hypothetical protein
MIYRGKVQRHYVKAFNYKESLEDINKYHQFKMRNQGHF